MVASTIEYVGSESERPARSGSPRQQSNASVVTDGVRSRPPVTASMMMSRDLSCGGVPGAADTSASTMMSRRLSGRGMIADTGRIRAAYSSVPVVGWPPSARRHPRQGAGHVRRRSPASRLRRSERAVTSATDVGEVEQDAGCLRGAVEDRAGTDARDRHRCRRSWRRDVKSYASITAATTPADLPAIAWLKIVASSDDPRSTPSTRRSSLPAHRSSPASPAR